MTKVLSVDHLIKGGVVMTYVMSDIHGNYEAFKKMLREINFTDDDLLYIAGDLVDYGADSMELVCDISMRADVYSVVGDHDLEALRMLSGFDKMSKSGAQPDAEFMSAMRDWVNDGGAATLEGFRKLDEDMNAHLETAKTVFEAARTLGAKYVRVFSFYAPEGKKITDMRDEVFAGMEALLKLAREYGVTLCHENEALIYGDVPERCRELLDHFGGELKCVFDMGNFVLEGVTPYPDAYELLKKDIAYFHIKDSLAAGAIVPPGKGEASIKEILAAYEAEFSHDFFVSLEPHLQLFDGKNALVGRAFENPYQYADAKEAFADAVKKFLELTAK